MAPRKKQVDWLAALDFKQATANVEGDLVGDWYVDRTRPTEHVLMRA